MCLYMNLYPCVLVKPGTGCSKLSLLERVAVLSVTSTSDERERDSHKRDVRFRYMFRILLIQMFRQNTTFTTLFVVVVLVPVVLVFCSLCRLLTGLHCSNEV